jgi:hypothetical protein
VAGTQEGIAAIARERQLQQLQSIDSLDTKAASLIGFAGVVLGLLFTAPASSNHWNAAMTAGASLIILAFLPLALALNPRTYSYNPNIAALLAGWGDVEPDQLYFTVTESVIRAVNKNQSILDWKARFVRAGVFALVAGLLVATAGVLYALNRK